MYTNVYAKTFRSPLRVSCKTLPSHAYILQAAQPRLFRQCQRESPSLIGKVLPLSILLFPSVGEEGEVGRGVSIEASVSVLCSINADLVCTATMRKSLESIAT